MDVGDIIKVSDVELLIIDFVDKDPFVVALNTGIKVPFSSKNTDYRWSDIKKEMEKWMQVHDFDNKSRYREVKLLTLNGERPVRYTTNVAPLTIDEYRTYANYIKPHIKESFWLATGWEESTYVCYVTLSGDANTGSYWTSDGLAPAFILNRTVIKNEPSLSSISTEDLWNELNKRINCKGDN